MRFGALSNMSCEFVAAQRHTVVACSLLLDARVRILVLVARGPWPMSVVLLAPLVCATTVQKSSLPIHGTVQKYMSDTDLEPQNT